MKILVTGGAGFIGSNLVDKLVELGHNIYVIDNLSTGNRTYLNKRINFLEMDLLSDELEKIIISISPEVVYHFAAQVNVVTSVANPILDQDINIGGTVRLLTACAKANVSKFIYSSSAAIYGVPNYLPIDENHSKKPISYYGISKWVPELYIPIFSEVNKMQYTILRYSNVFGPRQAHMGEGGVISIFINKFLKGEELVVYGDGNQTRDFIYVKDIVSANVSALKLEENGVFNISSNESISINNLICLLEKYFESKAKVSYVEGKLGDIRDSTLSNDYAIKKLEWRPQHSIEKGLEETIDYYKNLQ